MTEIVTPVDLSTAICKEWTKLALARMSVQSTPSVVLELTGYSEVDVPFVLRVLVPHIQQHGYDAECCTRNDDDEEDEDGKTIVFSGRSHPCAQQNAINYHSSMWLLFLFFAYLGAAGVAWPGVLFFACFCTILQERNEEEATLHQVIVYV
jgi:hypothetical protein